MICLVWPECPAQVSTDGQYLVLDKATFISTLAGCGCAREFGCGRNFAYATADSLENPDNSLRICQRNALLSLLVQVFR